MIRLTPAGIVWRAGGGGGGGGGIVIIVTAQVLRYVCVFVYMLCQFFFFISDLFIVV